MTDHAILGRCPCTPCLCGKQRTRVCR